MVRIARSEARGGGGHDHEVAAAHGERDVAAVTNNDHAGDDGALQCGAVAVLHDERRGK